jgi:hypothetical protein
MKRIYIPTSSAEDWRQFLAKPDIQWSSGYSARELAECWEGADGFPSGVQAVLATSPEPALRELTLLFAIPEFKVNLPPVGGKPSQNDLFVLARARDGGLVVTMVEGKVSETFGPLLGDWFLDGRPGKQERHTFLCKTLRLMQAPPPEIRYQLMHRTASAILTAHEFNTSYAVMLVHSFSPEHTGLVDYKAFLGLFKARGDVGILTEIPGHDHPRLFAGWVADLPRG